MEVFNAQMAELVDALVSNTNEVTLVPVRLRLWVQRLAAMQAFFVFNQFLPIPSQNLHRRLVDDFSTIEPTQYNRKQGNHQAFSTRKTSGARTQRLGPTFEVYQNREGFKVLYLKN